MLTKYKLFYKHYLVNQTKSPIIVKISGIIKAQKTDYKENEKTFESEFGIRY
jgi:hypothetical protein